MKIHYESTFYYCVDVYPGTKDTTTKLEEVTCKNCLSSVQKKYEQSLTDLEHADAYVSQLREELEMMSKCIDISRKEELKKEILTKLRMPDGANDVAEVYYARLTAKLLSEAYIDDA